MTKKLLPMLAALAVSLGCGGSSTPNPAANFEGSWPAVNFTVTVTCPGQTPASQNSSTSYNLGQGTGADLQGSSKDGCQFKWNVSGNNATLANAPVSCSSTINGTTYVYTFNSYTLSTSDGHNLALTAGGTVQFGGTTCNDSITGSGTR